MVTASRVCPARRYELKHSDALAAPIRDLAEKLDGKNWKRIKTDLLQLSEVTR